MTLTIKIEKTEIEKAICNLRNTSSNMPDVLLQAGETVKGWIIENVRSAGNSSYLKIEPWQPPSPFTLRLKKASGKGNKLLKGFCEGWEITGEDDKSVTIGTTKSYAIYHQKGAIQNATEKQASYMWAKYGIGFKEGSTITLPSRKLAGELKQNALINLAKLIVTRLLNR